MVAWWNNYDGAVKTGNRVQHDALSAVKSHISQRLQFWTYYGSFLQRQTEQRRLLRSETHTGRWRRSSVLRRTCGVLHFFCILSLCRWIIVVRKKNGMVQLRDTKIFFHLVMMNVCIEGHWPFQFIHRRIVQNSRTHELSVCTSQLQH